MATTGAAAKETVPAAKANGGTQAATPAAATGANSLALYKRDVVDAVADKVQQYINNGEMHLPKNYSPANALKSAWLILQSTVDMNKKPALEVCTRNSVANFLLDMVIQGLNPAKKQCYPIVYGNQLVCQRSYFGSMAVAEMVNPDIADWGYAVVYKGDTFKYGIRNGKKYVEEHIQDIANVSGKEIIAAYCMALDKNGDPIRTEIATWEQIKQAWKQSKMNPIDDQGNVKSTSTHGKFFEDMAIKTIVNKTCKVIINASSDSTLLLERINRSEDLADAAAVEAEIDESANTGPVLEIPTDTTVTDDLHQQTKEKEEPSAEATETTPRMPGW